MKKLYVVHSNEVLPYNDTINKIEIVTDDPAKARAKLDECIEDWKETRTGSENYRIESDLVSFSAFMDGDYVNDHYDVMIDEVEPVLLG